MCQLRCRDAAVSDVKKSLDMEIDVLVSEYWALTLNET